MKLYEFVFLVLGIMSLIDYLKYSIIKHKWKELIQVTGEPLEVKLKRNVEFVIIIITFSIFIYKFLF